MHQHVAVGGDREVALAPAIDLVQVGGVVDGEELACLPGSVPSRRGSAHAFIMHTFFYDGRAIGQKTRRRARASPITVRRRSTPTAAVRERACRRFGVRSSEFGVDPDPEPRNPYRSVRT